MWLRINAHWWYFCTSDLQAGDPDKCGLTFELLYTVIINYYLIIFLEIAWRKKINKICEPFINQQKVNESNTKLSTHYWMICLHSINFFFATFLFPINVLISFWDLLNTKTIKICHIITIPINSYPVSSSWLLFIKICYICLTLYLR